MDPILLAAAALREAYDGAAVGPLRDWLEPHDAGAAYSVQLENLRYWQASGRRAVGYKIGLTSKAAQTAMGTPEPDYGVLYADTRIASGAVLAAGRARSPRVEGEVALVLGSAITDPHASDEQIAAAVATAHAAIEICDSRIADWKIALADTIADNGSAGFFVMDDAGTPLTGLDLYSCGMVMQVDGAVVSLGAGAATGGHPLNGLAWLARKLAASGRPLVAGDIVLTGSLGAIVPVAPGAQVEVTIGGLGSCSFTLGG